METHPPEKILKLLPAKKSDLRAAIVEKKALGMDIGCREFESNIDELRFSGLICTQ